MARPQVEIDLKELEKLSELDCTDREIASFFDVSIRTVERRRKEDPAFGEALERGYGKGNISIRRKQYQAALKGDRTMLVWLGKQRLGQRDLNRYELTGANGSAIEVENSDRTVRADQLADIAAGLEGVGAIAQRNGSGGLGAADEPTKH